MRISDWSSDVCSSDLDAALADHIMGTGQDGTGRGPAQDPPCLLRFLDEIGEVGPTLADPFQPQRRPAALDVRREPTFDLSGESWSLDERCSGNLCHHSLRSAARRPTSGALSRFHTASMTCAAFSAPRDSSVTAVNLWATCSRVMLPVPAANMSL